jgi:hypothetical protein
VLSLTLLLAVPASAVSAPLTGQARTESLPPPPQMGSVYPMLGYYKCADTPPPGVTPADLYVTNTKGLGGHYLDSLVVIPNVVRGRSVMGWDPVNGNYFTFYADDWGTSGMATAPDWADGHLIFKGWTIQTFAPNPTGHAQGIRLDGVSDYQIVGPGHYIDTVTSVLPDGRSIQHIYDCRRL